MAAVLESGRSVALCLVALLAAVACGGPAVTPSARPATAALSGTYRGAGSGAALESLTALAKKFMEQNAGALIKLEDANAETAVVLVQSGEVDFGFLSRDLRPEERGKVSLVPFAGTGTGIAVNPANGVTGLSKEQIRAIYGGEITDWAQVGGAPGEIRVIQREPGSAVRASFESYVFGGKPAYGKNVIEVVESTATYKAVRDFKGAIAMITVQKTTVEDPTMRVLAVDGVAATTRNVNSGAYPMRRPIYLALNVDPAKVRPAVTAFIDFIKSPAGQDILAGF